MGDHERVHVVSYFSEQENVLKEETPSEARDRQSPNFVQRDSRAADEAEFVAGNPES